MVCKHVVESAEGSGEDDGIRVGRGGGRCVRIAEFIEVGLVMLGGAIGGAANSKAETKVEASIVLVVNEEDGRRSRRLGAARWRRAWRRCREKSRRWNEAVRCACCC